MPASTLATAATLIAIGRPLLPASTCMKRPLSGCVLTTDGKTKPYSTQLPPAQKMPPTMWIVRNTVNQTPIGSSGDRVASSTSRAPRARPRSIARASRSVDTRRGHS